MTLKSEKLLKISKTDIIRKTGNIRKIGK